MDRLWQDLRYSVRTLRTQPMFAVVAVLTLALGVGANAAIFSVCQAVLFKPLPYPEPDRLAMVWEREMRTGTLGGFAPANFVDVRGQSTSFERLAAFDPLRDFTLTGHGNSEHVIGAAVTSEFFLAQIDPDLALTRVRTMEDVVYSSVGEPRIRAILLGAFALVALTLASIGVYGVMNYIVSQRTREFGVRMALGATGGDLLRLILERSLRLIAIGLGVGLLGAVGLARLVRTLLYGVSPHDLLTLASVSILLAAVAQLASYLPARRGTLIDPAEALRMD